MITKTPMENGSCDLFKSQIHCLKEIVKCFLIYIFAAAIYEILRILARLETRIETLAEEIKLQGKRLRTASLQKRG